MKYIKPVLLILVLCFIFLFFYQNREYLLTTHAFTVNLYFTGGDLPALATGFYIVFAFLIGLVVMFVMSLFPRFKTTRELKQLKQDQAQIERLKKENSELLDNICSLRDQPNRPPEQESAQANPSLPEPDKEQAVPN